MKGLLLLLVFGLAGLPAAPATAAPTPTCVKTTPAPSGGPVFDVQAAADAVRTDSVYLAPGATGRVDVRKARALLAPLDAYLVLAPAGLTYADVAEPLTDAVPDRPGFVFTGLRLTVVGQYELGLEEPQAATVRHLHELLATSDVTSVLQDSVRALASADPGRYGNPPAAAPVVTPVAGPADPVQVDRLAAAMAATPFYVYPGVRLPISRSCSLESLIDGVAYRIVFLPALAPGAPEPALLPALAARFPGEVVVLARGRWLSAAGPDAPAVLRAAVDASNGDYLHELLGPGDLSDPAYRVVRRVQDQREADPRPRPTLAPGARAVDTGRAVAPWVFAGVAVLLLAAVVLGWGRHRVRTRRAEQRRYRVEHARLTALAARLAADVRTVEAGGNERAARRMAEAAERHATAADLLERAQSSEELAAVRSAVEEGLELTEEARRFVAKSAARSASRSARKGRP